MLGRGLESLIPKKKKDDEGTLAGSQQVQQDYKNDDVHKTKEDDSVEFYFETGTSETETTISSVESPDDIAYKQEKKLEQEEGDSIDVTGENSFGDMELEKDAPIFRIETDAIEFNPYQPRKYFNEDAIRELAASIREYGILQPLVVQKVEEETETGTKVRYVLIAGQRRLMAARMLGMKTVPAIIRRPQKETEPLEMAIVENIQREDLNVIERARAYARLSDEFGLTQREIAIRLGKSREYVANTLRLLSLPTKIQDALARNEINESHARLLMQINDAQLQEMLLDEIIRKGLSTRELKKLIELRTKKEQGVNYDKERNIVETKEDPKIKILEKELSEFLGAPVKVEFKGKSGKIVIHFYSPEEVEGIVHKIKKEEDLF